MSPLHLDHAKPKTTLLWGVMLLFALLGSVHGLGLSVFGGSMSYFSDYELAQGNVFSASLLDLLATSTDETILAIQYNGDVSYEAHIGPHEKSIPLLFHGQVKFMHGSSTFCDLLYLRADKDNEQVYWGSLLGFNIWDVSEAGQWEFLIKYPDHEGEMVDNNTVCGVDFVFDAFDASKSSTSTSGYTDSETISLAIVKTPFACLGSNCAELTIDTEQGSTTEEIVATSTATTTATTTATSTATTTEEILDEDTATSTATTTPTVEEEEPEDETSTTTEEVVEEDRFGDRRLRPTRTAEPLDARRNENR